MSSDSADLLPCPFCGGEAEIVLVEEGDLRGGSCVQCPRCMASGNVEFGRKENFVANWNRRAGPALYLMTGPWENDPTGKNPGIYMDDPKGGDPLLVASLKRIHRPSVLRAALRGKT